MTIPMNDPQAPPDEAIGQGNEDLTSLLQHAQDTADGNVAVVEQPQPKVNPRPSARERAYNAIDSERDYQDRLWGSLDERYNNVGDFLIYMQNYLNNAIARHNSSAPDVTLAQIRKVTALGVAAMEANIAPQREGYER